MKLSLISESGTRLTQSMVAFINDATNNLYRDWIQGKDGSLDPFWPNKVWHTDLPITQGEWGDSIEVIGPDGLKMPIQIGGSTVGSSSQLYWPDEKGDWGTGFEPFGVIYLDRKQTKDDKGQLKEIIAHELTHLFDVRFRTTHKANKANKAAYQGRYKQAIANKAMAYHHLPTETDAVLSSLALRRLSEMQDNGLSREEMKEAIKSIKPKYDTEKTLFRNQKQYRRYIQTLYRMLSDNF